MTFLSFDHLPLVPRSQRGQISYAFVFFESSQTLSNRWYNSSCVWTRVFAAAERGESVGQFWWFDGGSNFVFSSDSCSVDVIVPCIRSCAFVEIERGRFAGWKICGREIPDNGDGLFRWLGWSRLLKYFGLVSRQSITFALVASQNLEIVFSSANRSVQKIFLFLSLARFFVELQTLKDRGVKLILLLIDIRRSKYMCKKQMIGEKVNDYNQEAMNQRAEDPVTFEDLNADDLW